MRQIIKYHSLKICQIFIQNSVIFSATSLFYSLTNSNSKMIGPTKITSKDSKHANQINLQKSKPNKSTINRQNSTTSAISSYNVFPTSPIKEFNTHFVQNAGIYVPSYGQGNKNDSRRKNQVNQGSNNNNYNSIKNAQYEDQLNNSYLARRRSLSYENYAQIKNARATYIGSLRRLTEINDRASYPETDFENNSTSQINFEPKIHKNLNDKLNYSVASVNSNFGPNISQKLYRNFAGNSNRLQGSNFYLSNSCGVGIQKYMSDTELTSNFNSVAAAAEVNDELQALNKCNNGNPNNQHPDKNQNEYELNCRYTYVEMPNKKKHLLNIGPEIRLISDALKALAQNYDIDPSSLDCFYKNNTKPIEVRNTVDAILGKEIRVERRSVFRLDLIKAKRSIGIRAKWKKTISEALRSTLPKYNIKDFEVIELYISFKTVTRNYRNLIGRPGLVGRDIFYDKESGRNIPRMLEVKDFQLPVSYLDGLTVTVTDQSDTCMQNLSVAEFGNSRQISRSSISHFKKTELENMVDYGEVDSFKHIY